MADTQINKLDMYQQTQHTGFFYVIW